MEKNAQRPADRPLHVGERSSKVPQTGVVIMLANIAIWTLHFSNDCRLV
jgi:hypothetical protein